MNTKWKAALIGGALLAGLSGTAAARDNVSFSLAFGVPAYTPYVAPPAPVYYAPPAVYYAPPPPRVYYAPAPVYGYAYYGGPRYYYGHRHRHHHHWR